LNIEKNMFKLAGWNGNSSPPERKKEMRKDWIYCSFSHKPSQITEREILSWSE